MGHQLRCDAPTDAAFAWEYNTGDGGGGGGGACGGGFYGCLNVAGCCRSLRLEFRSVGTFLGAAAFATVVALGLGALGALHVLRHWILELPDGIAVAAAILFVRDRHRKAQARRRLERQATRRQFGSTILSGLANSRRLKQRTAPALTPVPVGGVLRTELKKHISGKFEDFVQFQLEGDLEGLMPFCLARPHMQLHAVCRRAN